MTRNSISGFSSFLDRPKDGTLNPHWVCAYVTRKDIEQVSLRSPQTHTTLGPAQVYGPLLDMADGDEEGR
jgi:hypothetical protein